MTKLIPSIESPCIRNCCLDDNDICLGCYRSITEVIQWGTATDEDKRAILVAAGERASVAKKANPK